MIPDSTSGARYCDSPQTCAVMLKCLRELIFVFGTIARSFKPVYDICERFDRSSDYEGDDRA